MKRILDKTDNGELWAEITAGLTVYHIDGLNGYHVATNKPAVAKREWAKLNASRGAEKQGVPV